jgi:hypothetical protein
MVQLAMVRRATLILAAFCVFAGACDSPSTTSSLSQDRIAALTQIGKGGKPSDIPSVLPSLSSDDPLVRWTAQRTLMQLAGTTNGYDWADSRPSRERAIQNWISWCRDHGVAPTSQEVRGG